MARRNAVVFAWFVPEGLPELGQYYFSLLQTYHSNSKLFIGMNHGSDPLWESWFRDSSMDSDVRWVPPEMGDYWDTTGFLTALTGFLGSDESFDLIWFGHSKGGSSSFGHTTLVRNELLRDFWERRAEIAHAFDDPRIGLFAPRYNLTPPYPFPGPWKGWTEELTALQRIYRDRYAPLGLCALDTFFVLRGGIVRRFCDSVDNDFFRTDPAAYGANKWFFEMAFPSIATMQGYEPFIDMDVPGADDSRDDLMVSSDVKQTHRLAGAEVTRWRLDPIAFEPRIIPWDRPAWAQSEPRNEEISNDAASGIQRTEASKGWPSGVEGVVEFDAGELSTHAYANLRDVPASAEMAITPSWAEITWVPTVGHITSLVPEHFADRPVPQRSNGSPRDAVVFAWFVPPQVPELGEYYLELLHYSHPDAKLFIGMNHGSDPIWEERFRESGLDIELRWARPEIDDYWDTTGFLTALESFHHSDESFRLVWFGHTKGGSQEFVDYAQIRFAQMRSFWTRRAQVEHIFADSRIGLWAPRFSPLPTGFYGDELQALQRIYRDAHAPIGLHAKETIYVVRADVVRRFCDSVDGRFFSTSPGEYGAGRYFFEIGFPNVASMQGYEPFINMEVAGDGHPRDDAWLRHDPKQNHRIAQQELHRWRIDTVGFCPRRIREVFSANDP